MAFTRRGFIPVRFIMSVIAAFFLNISVSENIYSSGANLDSKNETWNVTGLSPQVLQLALHAVESARNQHIGMKNELGIIDYSLPSTKKRFWVLDYEHKKLLFYEYVAHGKGSGENFATSFSNIHKSLQSSLGLFITESTYKGKHDYSLRLRGLEPGINDNAKSRAIVIHGASYINEEIIEKYGRLGRSFGCPSVRDSIARPMIDSLKDGSLIFAYYPDSHWLSTSTFLNP